MNEYTVVVTAKVKGPVERILQAEDIGVRIKEWARDRGIQLVDQIVEIHDGPEFFEAARSMEEER